ncbi:thiamin pyrophosphokinase 1-like protein [Hesseltinella vesiculosa]|uniref:Thiamine pyrophosphokinase n=1 Tax=Hesseltinella vesiculosa TaxID=101127 RepID=A0A1X2GAA6_9FUNG|nr:thiamin pyrophosphokinase 1-like protein [Hesseltinella vesiculosa]
MNIITHWCPGNILDPNAKPNPFCLIILDQPLTHVKLFERLWDRATFKFAADGGANRLYDAFKDTPTLLEKYVPDEIAGDMDSLRDDTKDYYESKGVPVTKVSEQMTTDLMKCVIILDDKEMSKTHPKLDIVAFPALGGRFDHTIANINILYELKDQIERRVILVSDQNLTILLDKGQHHIHCLKNVEGPHCGIMPIGAPATMTTKGLKWNLENHKCFFGGMVSTCNVFDSDLIQVETDSPVVWTTEIMDLE